MNQNKSLTKKFIEDAWNEARYDEARNHLASDFVNHTPFGDETRDAFLDRIKAFRAAFPDWSLAVDEMLCDGDFVVTRFTGRGTHRAAFRGIEATGRKVSVMGLAIDRVVDGKRVEGWAILDLFGLLEQLGAGQP